MKIKTCDVGVLNGPGNMQACILLLECFVAKTKNCGHADAMFSEILKVLLTDHRAKRFVEKILATNLTSKYCLTIIEIMKDFVFEQLPFEFDSFLTDLSEFLLQELFELYLADELLFKKYISEMPEFCLQFHPLNMVLKLCSYVAEDKTKTKQQVFSFLQIILEKNLKFFHGIEYESIMNAFDLPEIPLLNIVHPPSKIIGMIEPTSKDCRYNFNETNDFFADLKRLLNRNPENFEVVSLKNLSRLALRDHAFTTYSHREALNFLYSVDIPVHLRQFLCYNFSGFSFKNYKNLNYAKRRKLDSRIANETNFNA